jgi:Haem-binding domain
VGRAPAGFLTSQARRDVDLVAPVDEMAVAVAAVRRGAPPTSSSSTMCATYANVAPMSFLVVNDVKGGREHLNPSQWDQPQPDLGEVVEAIDGGGMPPLQYKLIHGKSRLSAAEKRELIAGFRKLYASDPPPIGGER